MVRNPSLTADKAPSHLQLVGGAMVDQRLGQAAVAEPAHERWNDDGGSQALRDAQSRQEPAAKKADRQRDLSAAELRTLALTIKRAKNLREVVGIFKTAPELENAAFELMSSGFDRSRLSLLAPEQTLRDQFGDRLARVDQLDDTGVHRIPYLNRESLGTGQGALIGGLLYVGAGMASGAVLMSGGALLPAFVWGAIAGVGGGALGGFLGRYLSNEVSTRIEREIDGGGLILWARILSDADEEFAVNTMRQNGASDVHAHGPGSLVENRN